MYSSEQDCICGTASRCILEVTGSCYVPNVSETITDVASIGIVLKPSKYIVSVNNTNLTLKSFKRCAIHLRSADSSLFNLVP